MPGATRLPRGPSALVLGSAEELLAGRGCPVCRYVAEAADAHLAWFGLEGHADPATITRLCGSLGTCPPHTRALMSQPGAAVRLTAVLGYVVGSARQALEADRPPPGPCPACEHERAAQTRAIDILLDSLADDAVRARCRDAGSLCFPHLRAAVSRGQGRRAALLGPAGRARRRAAAWLAGEGARLAGRPPGVDALAGWPDPDAERRASLRAGLPPGDALDGAVAPLGACPACWTAARSERDALLRVSSGGGRLCGAHLRDAAGLAPGSAAATLARQARLEMAFCERIAAGRAPADPAGGCPVCRARDAARWRALAACGARLRPVRPGRLAAPQARPGSGPAEAAGALCVRDALGLAGHDRVAGQAAAEFAARRAAILAGELAEAFGKRTWERRREEAGAETTAWQRAAAFLDGAVFGGGPAPAPRPR